RICETTGPVFEHVLVDDAQELDFGASSFVRALGRHRFVAGDPRAGLVCLRAASDARMAAFAALERARVVTLAESLRSPRKLQEAGGLLLGLRSPSGPARGEIAFWRCENRRAQGQAVAADIERLVTR